MMCFDEYELEDRLESYLVGYDYYRSQELYEIIDDDLKEKGLQTHWVFLVDQIYDLDTKKYQYCRLDHFRRHLTPIKTGTMFAYFIQDKTYPEHSDPKYISAVYNYLIHHGLDYEGEHSYFLTELKTDTKYAEIARSLYEKNE